jgi:hypothetical protein
MRWISIQHSSMVLSSDVANIFTSAWLISLSLVKVNSFTHWKEYVNKFIFSQRNNFAKVAIWQRYLAILNNKWWIII